VRRILRVKFELGLFEQPFVDKALAAQVGCANHRAVAREAVQKSLVLLKNKGAVLPLSKKTRQILVAGQAADDIGLQCGGWTIEWMGASGSITPGTTLLTAIRAGVSAETVVQFEPDGDFTPTSTPADVGIVVLSEPPYAEGVGDRADLNLPQTDVALLERMRTQCHNLVVILYSGRPLIITHQLPLMDALVAAWLPGTEGQGMVDVLFGDVPFSGNLPFTWPRSMAQVSKKENLEHDGGPLFAYGYGL
jgi:beta-glucosidase